MKKPLLRFPEFDAPWEYKKVGDVFDVTRGRVLAMPEVSPAPEGDKAYPVFSSQTKKDGLAGYYDQYLFENAITWTTDGANAGDTKFRAGKFYCTNVCGVLLSDEGYANTAIAELINSVSRRHVSYVGNPKLMNNVMSSIKLRFPSAVESQKIASFLGAIDKRIQGLRRQKELLTQYKTGLMQKLFSQEIRFKDEDGKEFPEWEEKRLGDVFEWIKTNSLSREHLSTDGGKVQNIHYGDIHTKFKANFQQAREAVPYIKDVSVLGEVPDEQYCRVGDVVIADASEDYSDIGKCVEITQVEEHTLVAGLHTFIARPKIDTLTVGFSGYLMSSGPMRRQVQRIAQGISVLGISKRNLEKLTFWVPCAAEQERISAVLSDLDDRLDSLGVSLEKLSSFKKGLLQQMFV